MFGFWVDDGGAADLPSQTCSPSSVRGTGALQFEHLTEGRSCDMRSAGFAGASSIWYSSSASACGYEGCLACWTRRDEGGILFNVTEA